MHINTMKLKQIRLERGLSLKRLALVADVSHDTVMGIENGTRNPHPGTVAKLARALDVPLTTLVDWDAEGITTDPPTRGTRRRPASP